MTADEIAKLPTLLDIVNHYLEGERRIEELHESGSFKGLFPTRAYKGIFEPLRMDDGTHILMPLSPAQHSYYRGENSYHEDCRPSLYRKGMTDADIFVERIKRCEMELMMRQYPITDLFASSIQAQAPDKTWIPIPFRIGYDGMAQHYGIKTEFMDITLDPWTAAFFAATKYDDATDSYSPIEDTDTYQHGIFYLRNEVPQLSPSHSRIDIVGMQPLSRPGCQSAYVFRMYPGENFNTMAQKNLFRHDAEVNRKIFEHANRGNRLFPKELIGNRIRREIVRGEEFSQLAPTIKVAEAAKVIENSQRDINIAFVNELSKIFNKMGIDTLDVLEAAGTKWNFLPFRPGLVGGHCIGVDPYYLAQCAQRHGYNPEIILAGRRMNDGMGEYVATETIKLMLKKGIQVLSSNIIILGFTFKENCPDVRNTKVIDIYKALKEYNLNITVYDPWANPAIVEHEYGIKVVNELPAEKFDAAIAAVAHNKFDGMDVPSLLKEKHVIFDVKCKLDRSIVDGRL